MFTWVENEIITINPGKESKKVRDGKFSNWYNLGIEKFSWSTGS